MRRFSPAWDGAAFPSEALERFGFAEAGFLRVLGLADSVGAG